MGVLATYVTARFPVDPTTGVSARLVGLTNPDIESATTVNTTQLANAETDATAEFPVLTGLVLDTTNALHLMTGYLGVVSWLMDYRGMPRSQAMDAARKEWTEACRKIDHYTGSHAWQSPVTNSTLLPSADPPGGALPYFDRKILADIVPRQSSLGYDDWTSPNR